MAISQDKITEIFFNIDEFCQQLDQLIEASSIGNPPKRKPKMSHSEIMTIMVLFHLKGFRDMKTFYNSYVLVHMKSEFPETVSYNRFTELMQKACLPLVLFLKHCCMGEGTGIAFIDSTPIRVCKNKRIFNHKTFDGIAAKGKSTMGWFYGFKLHLVVNDRGELLSFMITPGNVDDREPLKKESFINSLQGKLFADKGYISKTLSELLFGNGIHLFTGIRRNMKNCLMSFNDKILLRKRSVIETINDQLKNICQVEHSRHRSFGNFISNLVAGLVAYSFFEKKPSIKFETENTGQMAIF